MKRIITILSLLAIFTSSPARTVKGSVRCGKEKLSGVIVTDGRNFTRTDSRGKFTLEMDDNADFVHIVTPSGYAGDWSEGRPEFFIPASSKSFVFQLQPYGEPGDDYSIIAIADPQTKTEKQFKQFQGLPMQDLTASCQEASANRSAIGLVLGDIAWDSGSLIFPKYQKEIVKTGIPFYPVIGNHDHELEQQGDHNSSGMYRSFFGPENYAFGLGKDYVVVLDNVVYDTQKKYVEGYSDETLDWLEGLIALIPESSTVYIAQHCPEFRWFKEPYLLSNGERLLDIMNGRQTVILSGHTHINYNFIHSPLMMEQNIASICGTWWIADHCNDGTPGGYKVLTKENGDLSWYYKTLGKEKDFQVEIFQKGDSDQYPDAIIANVWDYDSEWKVEWFQDGKPMGAMQQVLDYSPLYKKELALVYPTGEGVPDYKQPRPNMHYFAATPSPDARSIKIVVTSRFGQSWTYEL